MIRWLLLLLLALASLSSPSFAGPRDAVAVLNRCGSPIGGDETILDNSVAGGHRTLKYERGHLHFDKVAMDGWTFVYATEGSHSQHLSADQMEQRMPCLMQALEDSAASAPIPTITSEERVAASVKDSYRRLILWAIGFLLVAGLLLFGLSGRRLEEDGN